LGGGEAEREKGIDDEGAATLLAKKGGLTLLGQGVKG